jgi:hypothetical protein
LYTRAFLDYWLEKRLQQSQEIANRKAATWLARFESDIYSNREALLASALEMGPTAGEINRELRCRVILALRALNDGNLAARFADVDSGWKIPPSANRIQELQVLRSEGYAAAAALKARQYPEDAAALIELHYPEDSGHDEMKKPSLLDMREAVECILGRAPIPPDATQESHLEGARITLELASTEDFQALLMSEATSKPDFNTVLAFLKLWAEKRMRSGAYNLGYALNLVFARERETRREAIIRAHLSQSDALEVVEAVMAKAREYEQRLQEEKADERTAFGDEDTLLD